MSKYLSPSLAGLAAYVPGEQPQDRRYIKLNTNENPYPPSPAVLAAVPPEAVARQRLYNDPAAAQLTAALAKAYGVSTQQVIATNGSDEILAFAFLAYGIGKPMAFPDITYGFYQVFAQLYGVQARAFALAEDFTVPLEQCLRSGEHLVLANPNAPTGLALTLPQLRRILAAHPQDVVVVDEAYIDFATASHVESAVALLEEFDNLLVVQTCSKSRSLAGARVGFAFGSEALIEDLQRVRNSFNPYNVSTLSQAMATAALEDTAYFTSCTQAIIETRAAFTSTLRSMGFVVADSQTNFVFPRHGAVEGKLLYQQLRAHGILVRWFDTPRLAPYVRITIGTPEEMQQVAAALRHIIDSLI